MTETDKTEAVIAAALTRKAIQAASERKIGIEAHARDLARKLDAVRNMCQNAEGADAQNLADSILDLMGSDQ